MSTRGVGGAAQLDGGQPRERAGVPGTLCMVRESRHVHVVAVPEQRVGECGELVRRVREAVKEDIDTRRAPPVRQQHGSAGRRGHAVVCGLLTHHTRDRRRIVGGGERVRAEVARTQWDRGRESHEEGEPSESRVEAEGQWIHGRY